MYFYLLILMFPLYRIAYLINVNKRIMSFWGFMRTATSTELAFTLLFWGCISVIFLLGFTYSVFGYLIISIIQYIYVKATKRQAKGPLR